MSEQFNVMVNLTTEVCIVCGIVFTLPCVLRDELIENGKSFCCPFGHRQYFPEDKDEKKVGEENKSLKSKLKYWKNKANKVKK